MRWASSQSFPFIRERGMGMMYRRIKKAILLAVVIVTSTYLPVFSQSAKSQEEPNPTMTFLGTRGLPYTGSAEALGLGRLSFCLTGTWYKQDIGYPLTPNSGTNVITGIGGFSFGVNPYIDIFASIAGFYTRHYLFTPTSGLGTVLAGAQGALPLPASSKFHLAAQLVAIGGTSPNQLDSNRADGFAYFETRTGYDFMGKLLQSAVFGTESQSIKIHANEGFVYSTQKGKKAALLLGMGIQGNVHPLVVIGLEVNSRTFLDSIAFRTDPLWLTPSIQLRTPYYMNLLVGADISLSKERTQATVRSLEQFRIFGGLDFTMDVLAGKKRSQEEKAKQAELEKQGMEKKQKQLEAEADSLAKKAKADSIAAEQQRVIEKRRADSLAQKAVQDSITLADTKHRLAEEISKRSDAEKQLLSTGMLLLDAVYFESGRTDISINSKPYLNIIGKMLSKYPKLQLQVAGHTDNVGRLEANRRLSFARAESVRQYLVSVAPDLANRLTAVGYGPDQPKADNRTASGRKVNRRVELQVTNKEVLKEYNP